MSKSAFVFTLTLIAALTPLHWSEGAVVYNSNEGWSVEGDDSQIAGNAIEQMHKAEELEAKHDDEKAYRAYKALVKKFGLSLLAPKAQRKCGILLEKHNDFDILTARTSIPSSNRCSASPSAFSMGKKGSFLA